MPSGLSHPHRARRRVSLCHCYRGLTTAIVVRRALVRGLGGLVPRPDGGYAGLAGLPVRAGQGAYRAHLPPRGAGGQCLGGPSAGARGGRLRVPVAQLVLPPSVQHPGRQQFTRLAHPVLFSHRERRRGAAAAPGATASRGGRPAGQRSGSARDSRGGGPQRRARRPGADCDHRGDPNDPGDRRMPDPPGRRSGRGKGGSTRWWHGPRRAGRRSEGKPTGPRD